MRSMTCSRPDDEEGSESAVKSSMTICERRRQACNAGYTGRLTLLRALVEKFP
jgi:hypothetical protein